MMKIIPIPSNNSKPNSLFRDDKATETSPWIAFETWIQAYRVRKQSDLLDLDVDLRRQVTEDLIAHGCWSIPEPVISVRQLFAVSQETYTEHGKLHRKSLPSGFCYICSRLDSSGRYKPPNGSLFGKRFPEKCEHQPRTPYPTMIEDDNQKIIERQSSNPEWNFGVSVTFKNRTTPEKTGKKFFSAAVEPTDVDENGNIKDPQKYHLPPVLGDKFEKVAFDDEISKFVPLVGEKTLAEAGPMSIEISHSGLHRTVNLQISDDEENNDDITEAHIEAVSVADMSKRKPESHKGSLPQINRQRDNLVSFGVIHDEEGDPHRVIINDLGTGGTERKRPRKWVISEGEPQRAKARAGKKLIDADKRQVKRQPRDNFGLQSNDGHLKYKHRDENSSLPPGNRQLSLDGTGLRGDGTYDSIDTSALDRTPSMIIQKITDMENWCQCASEKCSECGVYGGHDGRCPLKRTGSQQSSICPKCEKPIKNESGKKKGIERRPSISTIKSEDVNMLRGKKTALKSSGKNSHRHVRFDDEEDDRLGTPYTTKSMDDMHGRRGAYTESDEDYMDYNALGLDTEGNVLTAMTKGGKLKGRPSKDGYLKPNPWPTFDPNIHRDAYIKALTARSLEKLKKYQEIDDKIYNDRLVRPLVFSYFKLRPGQKKALPDGPEDIGIRPMPKSKSIPLKKAMGHIFGKLKVSDFYPGGKKDDSGAPKIETKKKSKKKKK